MKILICSVAAQFSEYFVTMIIAQFYNGLEFLVLILLPVNSSNRSVNEDNAVCIVVWPTRDALVSGFYPVHRGFL